MFKPGWLISLLFVGIFVYLCFTMLAPWQLNKYEDLKARNASSLRAAWQGRFRWTK